MHYSYFLLKPDGIKYIKQICKQIESIYKSVKYYAVDDFESLIKKLYHRHYEEKGSKFKNSFDSYLYGLKETYGNESVLILIGDSREYEDLVKSVADIKAEIRKKYANNNIGIVTNYGNRRGYIRFISEDGEETSPRIMKELGSYRINDMNIIHSPNADKETTLEELDILIEEGIIDDRNLITFDMIKKMKKYQTVALQRDMKEPEYQGEIQPNISGWIKEQIKSSKDDESR